MEITRIWFETVFFPNFIFPFGNFLCLIFFFDFIFYFYIQNNRITFLKNQNEYIYIFHLIIYINFWIFAKEGSYIFSREPRRVLPNSKGLYLIFSSASFHLHTFSHTISSSHLLVFTASLPPSHIHICSSSPFLIFTSCHLHTFSSSHRLPFTSVALHIFSSSHLLTITPALTPSHLLIFSLSLSCLLYLLSLGRVWCRRRVTKHKPLQTRWGSIVKKWGNCAFTFAGTTLSHENMVNRQKI